MRRAFLLLLLAGCTDPVRDDAIAALGPEDPAVAPGADHRPGQPCVLCHSRGGPAADRPFAVAGTVYATRQPNAAPAEGIFVQFVDARGGAPGIIPRTGPSGNFYVREGDWPDLAYPFRVAIYRDPNQPPIAVMKSLVGREGSCAACHRRSGDNKVPLDLADDDRSFVDPIYVTGGSP